MSWPMAISDYIHFYTCSEQSTPGDLYDYHDTCGGINPDTPYVRGYSANGGQWQGHRSGGAGDLIMIMIIYYYHFYYHIKVFSF